ncbi:SUMF1/EgtB/PvdO family nonheme iron enzyme [bacterium]|nr:SUMF1/EgtB/PvdO family nonheme iron enzyme [bacterium]
MKKIILISALAIIVSGCELKKLDWDKFIDENKTDKEVVDSDSEETVDTETPEPDTETPEIDHETIVDEETPDTKNDENIEVDEDAQDNELIDDSEPIDLDENEVDEEQIDESVDEDVVPVDPEMVLIPAGEFWMGCNEVVDLECENDEKPYHKVFLNSYNIDKYEVTAGEYKECVIAGNCTAAATVSELGPNCNYENSGKENHPINCVNWSQAESYCKWKGKRLPTEAEWEKAARGTDGRKHPWGNLKESCNYAVISEAISGGNGCGTNGTMEVGSKVLGISPYGVHDLIGNVWEWVADWYSSDYYSISQEINPTGPINGTHKIIRGGSWYGDSEGYLRSSSRNFVSLDHQSISSGFRCAKSVQMVSCTGITKCYNNTEETTCPASGDFYGQDAQYLDKCVPRSYTISGSVIDNNTQLQWQRTLPTSYSGCTKGSPVGTQCTWQESVNYCDGLYYSGFEDWRLPTRKELSTLADYGKNNPSIDLSVFPDTPGLSFWVSTQHLNDLSMAWFVDFSEGQVYFDEKNNYKMVRCIRGDAIPESSFEEFYINEKIVVVDSLTQLSWTKEISSSPTEWKGALNYCENLIYADYDDWRLPNINELKTIIDDSKYNPSSSFPGIVSQSFWTSSQSINLPSYPPFVDFNSGEIRKSYNNNPKYAICVR